MNNEYFMESSKMFFVFFRGSSGKNWFDVLNRKIRVFSAKHLAAKCCFGNTVSLFFEVRLL